MSYDFVLHLRCIRYDLIQRRKPQGSEVTVCKQLMDQTVSSVLCPAGGAGAEVMCREAEGQLGAEQLPSVEKFSSVGRNSLDVFSPAREGEMLLPNTEVQTALRSFGSLITQMNVTSWKRLVFSLFVVLIVKYIKYPVECFHLVGFFNTNTS